MPKYEHTCKHCRYLGTFTWQDSKGIHMQDVYYHKYDNYATLISRYGDHPAEYYSKDPLSGISLTDPGYNAGLLECFLLGLVKPEDVKSQLVRI